MDVRSQVIQQQYSDRSNSCRSVKLCRMYSNDSLSGERTLLHAFNAYFAYVAVMLFVKPLISMYVLWAKRLEADITKTHSSYHQGLAIVPRHGFLCTLLKIVIKFTYRVTAVAMRNKMQNG